MTYEEMQAVQERVAAGLREQGFTEVSAAPFAAGELPEVYCITATEADGPFELAVSIAPL
jgi:hypothetical protein